MSGQQDDVKILNFKLSKLSELPSLPHALSAVLRTLEDPMSSTKDLEHAIMVDQALTLRVLKLANSGFYAIPGGSSSLARCLTFLGQEVIYQLAISSSLIAAFKIDKSHFDCVKFWQHSFGVATVAAKLAQMAQLDRRELAFLGGVAHDIGKLALLKVAPKEYLPILAEAKQGRKPLEQLERDRLGIDHSEVGSNLAENWRLPHELIHLIRFHHRFENRQFNTLPNELIPYILIVGLANQIAHHFQFGESGNFHPAPISLTVFGRLQFDVLQLPKILEELKAELQKAELLVAAFSEDL